MITLAQTLHGYERGHRLLAHGGDVTEDELSLLDRLSDLSGYLPSGITFDHYDTGFPCGRYYALSRTWLDTAATRAGTVLTHTLLIPHAAAIALADIFTVALYHRRPLSAEDVEPYRQALTAVITPATPGDDMPAPPPGARDALALLVGQRQRPILWLDRTQPTGVLRYLWSMLLPAWRARWAFCTLALQERHIDGQPFDFLGVPPEAQGSFHALAASPAWWRQDEGLAQPELATQPAVATLYAGGPSAMAALADECSALDLPVIAHASDAPPLLRYPELRRNATIRVTAARARVELLTRLWPEVPVTHPEWQAALSNWIALQAQAPLAPRPLWELVYLTTRRELTELLAAASDASEALEQAFCQMLTAELARRIAAIAEMADAALRSRLIEELGVLLPALPSPAAHEAARLGIIQAMRTASTSRNAAHIALEVAARLGDAGLLRQCLAPLFPSDRIALICDDTLLPAASDRAWLDTEATAAAIELGDPELAFAVSSRLGDPPSALRAATRAARQPGASEAMSRVLLQVSPELCLIWSLEANVPELAAIGAEHGIHAANALQIDEAGLAAHAAGKANGARVFARRHSWLPDKALAAILKEWPILGHDLLALAMEDPSAVNGTLVRASTDMLPTSALFTEALRHRVAAAQGQRSHSELPRLALRLITDIADGSLAPQQAIAWLTLPGMRQWLRRASTGSLDHVPRRARQDALTLITQAVDAALAATPPDNEPEELHYPLIALLREAQRPALSDAHDALVSLLGNPGLGQALLLRTEVLLAAQRTRTGPSLWAAVFHDVYRAVLNYHPAIRDARWPSRWSWNRGKELRHLLLDTWVDERWPVTAFLQCLDSDDELAGRVFMRAAKESWRHRDFLRNLDPAIREIHALVPAWQGAIDKLG